MPRRFSDPEELNYFRRFSRSILLPQEERVLKLLSTDPYPQDKAIALGIGRSVKTVERIKTSIADKYALFYQEDRRAISFRKIVIHAGVYFDRQDPLDPNLLS